MTEEGTTKQQDETYCSNCGALVKKDVQFCPQCGAKTGGRPGTMPPPEQEGRAPESGAATFDQIPIRIEFQYPERMSRWLLWFKWLLIIPHQIVLYFYGLAVFFTTFIAWWAILFTGRYPQGLFDFAVGYMRWNLRVAAYFPFLMTDRYPPFGAGDHAVSYEVDYPEGLSRGVVLLRFFMALPVFPFFWFLLFALYVLWPLAIAFYVLLAWIWLCLLCTAAYPRGLYNFVAAVLAWQQRAYSWWFLLRDDWSLFGTKGVKVVESRPAM